jgi:hypothetical protein
MSVPLPIGGSSLMAIRLQGQRPPGTIWVTDDRTLARRARERLQACALIVDFEREYDMRCVHGLDVCLHSNGRREKTVDVSQAILAVEPHSFRVWIGTEQTEWVIPWTPYADARR